MKPILIYVLAATLLQFAAFGPPIAPPHADPHPGWHVHPALRNLPEPDPVERAPAMRKTIWL